MQSNQKKISTHLFLLFLIFLFPVVAGWFLYFYHDQFHFKTTNHGELVKPPINLQNFGIIDQNEKLWHVLYVFNAPCATQCKDIDYQLHQIQIALGKDHNRIKILTVNASVPELNKLKMRLAEHQPKNFLFSDKIYLVDPLGNLFMYYASETNLMNVLKDLKKVLEVSQIG